MRYVRKLPSFSTVVTGAVMMFLYAPIVLVFINSFNSNEALVRWGGFTTEWYKSAFNNDRVIDDLQTSLMVAVISTLFALVIAVTAGLWIRGATAKGQRVMDAATYMRIILPEVVLAFAIFILLTILDIRLGFWTVVVGHVIVNSAYATIVIQARLASLDGNIEEAARDLGATPRRVFTRVTMPMLMPGVIVAGLLIFTFSFDNVVMSQFLGGASTETLPVLVLGMIRRNVTPEVNAIGVGIMLVMFISIAIAAAVTSFRPSGGSRIIGLEKKEDN